MKLKLNKFTKIVLIIDILLVCIICSLFIYGNFHAIKINTTIDIVDLQTHINKEENKLNDNIEINNLYDNKLELQKYVGDNWKTVEIIENTNINDRDIQKYNYFETTINYKYNNNIYEKYRIYIPEYKKTYLKGIYPVKIHVDEYISDEINIIIKNKDAPDITSTYGCIMDSNGNILFGKKENKKAYPASITKITTFALSSKLMKENNISINDKLILSNNAVNTPYTYFGEKNDKITYDTAFKAAMILSSNGITVALAENLTNSNNVNKFVDLMNKFVEEEVKTKNTHYENTHGLHEDNHYSTASDICKIAKWNMENNKLFTDYINIYESKEILYRDEDNIKKEKEENGEEDIEITKDDREQKITLHTTNSIVSKLHDNKKLFEARYIGGKTGTEDIDGSNLISIIEWKNNIYYICTLQAKNSSKREKDQIKLIKWVEANI